MTMPVLLLIDLRDDRHSQHVCVELTDRCQLHVLDKQLINNQQLLSHTINMIRPDVICFEYDRPNNHCLKMLELTKNEHPSIPVLMVTEKHDEALAVWALRARVWDYFVKPVATEDIYLAVVKLSRVCVSRVGNHAARDMVRPGQKQWINRDVNGSEDEVYATLNVIKYVEQHYHEKIYISVLAKSCIISPHLFSRVFRRENGVSFRTYLVNYRLDKARELLHESQLSVGDVSFAVGFLDHSYFTRIFKNRMGISPSDFRIQRV